MLKKIGSFFISSLALTILGLLSILFVVRMFFMPSSMSKLAKTMFNEEVFMAEELDKYIEKDILIDEMGKFLSDYFKYVGGAPGSERPSIEAFVDIIKEMIENYEKETGEEIANDADFEELYNELESSMDALLNESFDEDVRIVFEIIYSQALLIGLIGAFVVCILLNYLIRKDWFIVMRHTGIVACFNGSIFIVCGVLVNYLAATEKEVSDVTMIKCFVDNFYTIGFISLVISVILIVLSIVIKKKNNDLNSSNNINNVMINNGIGN